VPARILFDRAVLSKVVAIFAYILAVILSALCVLVLSFPAFGQMPGRGATPPPTNQMPGKLPRCPVEEPKGAAPDLTVFDVKQRLASLKEELHISGDTGSVFDEYARQLTAYTADEERRKTGKRSISVSATSRLGHFLDDARNKYSALEALNESAVQLLSRLSPQQRRLADAKMLPIFDTQAPQ